jgi:hypothetical protein
MAVTILEALQNAQINLVIQKMPGFTEIIGAEQLNNAIVLLEKGYSPSDEVEPLLGKYGKVDKVPEKGDEKEKTILELEARLSERSTIVYVIQSAMVDQEFSEEYKKALNDEILNHNLAIAEYNEGLKKLKPQ